MAAKSKASLISDSSKIDQIFDDDVIWNLVKIAKAPSNSFDLFGRDIRDAARIFVEAKQKWSSSQINDQIGQLYKLTVRAEDGSDETAQELAEALNDTPAEVFDSIIMPDGWETPTASEIRSRETRGNAINRLRAMLSSGGSVEPGRKRPGGRRSKTYKPTLRSPYIEAGRPPGIAEREFVQNLALAYKRATGRLPPLTANANIDIRGPFPRLVHECFELVGAPTGNVTRLLNEYGEARKEPSDS